MKVRVCVLLQCLVLVLALSLFASAKVTNRSASKLHARLGHKPRVLNGVKTKPGQYPFSVYITIEGLETPGKKSRCGGTIIDELHVLSAGHCFQTYKPYNQTSYNKRKKFQVKANQVDIHVAVGKISEIDTCENPPYKVKKITLHENYTSTNYTEHDLAILELKNKRPFNFSEAAVAPVDQLNNPCNPLETDSLKLIGYGRIMTKDFKFERSDELMLAENFEILPQDHPECGGKESLICIRSSCKGSQLRGDSGSSYFGYRDANVVLMGVVNRRSNNLEDIDCKQNINQEWVSVMSSVSFHYDWIIGHSDRDILTKIAEKGEKCDDYGIS